MDLLIMNDGRTERVACQAMLFDMDGTLVDSHACVERTWRAWAQRHGIDADALIAIAHGRQNPDVMREVAPHLDNPEEHAFMVRAEEDCRDGIVPIAGAPELLTALPADRWAVVTSCWRRLAEIRLECAGLPTPALLITADNVANSKPHPEGYLVAARRLGIPPSACVVFEDSPAGIAAGRAAGMTVIGMTTTFDRQQLGCALAIPDLRAVRVA